MNESVFVTLIVPYVSIPVITKIRLEKDNIEVSENGEVIEDFKIVKPVAKIVILNDISRSMGREKLGGAINAAKAFVDLCEEDAELALVKFSTSIKVISHFTQEKEEIKNVMAFKSGGLGTRLYDGIWKSLKLFSKEENYAELRVIVFYSDGLDNISLHRYNGVIKLAKKGKVQIFTAGYGSSPGKINERVLEGIASETGGEYQHAPNGEKLKERYKTISETIKNTYLLLYDSPKFADGSEREVLVRTNNPDALEIKRKYISMLHSSEILWREDVNSSHEGVGQ